LIQTILHEDDFIDRYGGPGWGTEPEAGPRDIGFMREKTFSTGKSERYYAIRYDDLKFGEECLSVAVEIGKWAPTAGLAAMLAAGGPVAVLVAVPATVAVVATKGLLTLAMRIRKRAADLSEDEFTVLAALTHHGPQSVESLVFLANDMRFSPPYQWTEERVTAILERLGKKRLRDGSVRALAEKAGDGLWSASGL
jgi:hypothetical protein